MDVLFIFAEEIMNRRLKLKQIRIVEYRVKQRYNRLWTDFKLAVGPAIENLRKDVLDVLRNRTNTFGDCDSTPEVEI